MSLVLSIYIYILAYYLFLIFKRVFIFIYIYICLSFYPTSRGKALHLDVCVSGKTGPTVDKTEGPRMPLRGLCQDILMLVL